MMETNLKLFVDFDIDSAWCAWFSGFVDGEGSFLLNRNKSTKIMSPVFQIKQRIDDQAIVGEIHYILRCGRMHLFVYRKARREGGKDADQVGLHICRIFDLIHILIPLLDRYPLRSKKRADYEIWRRAVLMIYRNNHASREQINDELLALKEQLESGRRFIPSRPFAD